MQKTILIIGAGILQAPAVSIAREMGLFTVVTDLNPNAYGMKFADFPIVMSTRDVDGTVRVAKEFAAKHRKIDGVITVGTDASLTVAAVQHALDLPGNRIDVAEATTNKIKMRRRLHEAGVPQPEYHPCWTYDDVLDAVKKLGYPFVIKPADNMGARGVMKVRGPEILRLAYDRAKNSSPRGEIICEGFMDGPELSIDALIWGEQIFVTGVADRIIEYPPYFVETGHIMPTNMDEPLLSSGIEVFKRGIRALGIETGAAKGDIKLTSGGAMVGEIASRLSGGFMSAYTYPYATGVNLIQAAIRIAMGNPPGDLEEKFHRVSAERAIIPGSGIVRAIDGIQEAMSVKGVMNVFVTCGLGETVLIPTSNVEKCGNVIAVGATREEALAAADLGVKMVRIRLGGEDELNEGIIRKNALEKLSGVCSVCRVCDGVECAGWLPGIGSMGTGTGFRRSLGFLSRFVVVPDLLGGLDGVSTVRTLFGMRTGLPVLAAPVSNIKMNLKGIYREEEFNRYLLMGARKAGSIACISQMEMDDGGDRIEYLTKPLADVSGHGIPFFNPSHGETVTLRNIEAAVATGVKTVGLSLDVRGVREAATVNDRRLNGIIGKSPVPVMVKGILTASDAQKAVEAGAQGIVLSNRGGRILDSLPSGVEVLPRVRKAVKKSALVMVDGGIRTGEDVFKALCLGADAVLIGRPLVIALAGALDGGVAASLEKIREELGRTMLIAGAPDLNKISDSMIERLSVS